MCRWVGAGVACPRRQKRREAESPPHDVIDARPTRPFCLLPLCVPCWVLSCSASRFTHCISLLSYRNRPSTMQPRLLLLRPPSALPRRLPLPTTLRAFLSTSSQPTPPPAAAFKKVPRLSPQAVKAVLTMDLPGWADVKGRDALEKTYLFRDFSEVGGEGGREEKEGEESNDEGFIAE